MQGATPFLCAKTTARRFQEAVEKFEEAQRLIDPGVPDNTVTCALRLKMAAVVSESGADSKPDTWHHVRARIKVEMHRSLALAYLRKDTDPQCRDSKVALRALLEHILSFGKWHHRPPAP